MSKRWLSGFMIFALGFGCASVVTIATAQDVPEEGELEEGLDYVNGDNALELINTGEKAYVVMVARKRGTPPAESQVSYKTGVMTVSKSGTDRVTVYRLVPVAQMEKLLRPCNEDFWDCPYRGPLPPPPPPLAEEATFFTSHWP